MQRRHIQLIKGFFFVGAGLFSGMAGFRLIILGGLIDKHSGFYLGFALLFFFVAMNILAFDLYRQKK